MTLQDISIDLLDPHPENSNLMDAETLPLLGNMGYFPRPTPCKGGRPLRLFHSLATTMR